MHLCQICKNEAFLIMPRTDCSSLYSNATILNHSPVDCSRPINVCSVRQRGYEAKRNRWPLWMWKVLNFSQLGKMTYRPETWKLRPHLPEGAGGNSQWIVCSGFWVSWHTPLLLLAVSVLPARLLVGICNLKSPGEIPKIYSHCYFFCCRHVPQWITVCSGLKV